MKRLLGLLLVMGMVGCGGTVDSSKLVQRDGLMYEGDSKTPFTGVTVSWWNNGQKKQEGTYKDGMREGLWTSYFEGGQKALLLGRLGFRLRDFSRRASLVLNSQGNTNVFRFLFNARCSCLHDSASAGENRYSELGRFRNGVISSWAAGPSGISRRCPRQRFLCFAGS